MKSYKESKRIKNPKEVVVKNKKEATDEQTSEETKSEEPKVIGIKKK